MRRKNNTFFPINCCEVDGDGYCFTYLEINNATFMHVYKFSFSVPVFDVINHKRILHIISTFFSVSSTPETFFEIRG